MPPSSKVLLPEGDNNFDGTHHGVDFMDDEICFIQIQEDGCLSSACSSQNTAQNSCLCKGKILDTTLSVLGGVSFPGKSYLIINTGCSRSVFNLPLYHGEAIAFGCSEGNFGSKSFFCASDNIDLPCDNIDSDDIIEISHTSCSAVYVAGHPAPLDVNSPNCQDSEKGDPSHFFLVKDFNEINKDTGEIRFVSSELDLDPDWQVLSAPGSENIITTVVADGDVAQTPAPVSAPTLKETKSGKRTRALDVGDIGYPRRRRTKSTKSNTIDPNPFIDVTKQYTVTNPASSMKALLDDDLYSNGGIEIAPGEAFTFVVTYQNVDTTNPMIPSVTVTANENTCESTSATHRPDEDSTP